MYRPNVSVFIIDEQKKILFCQRRDKKGFQLPQGGIEPGETAEQALRREIKEETCLENFKILGKASETVKYKWSDDFVSKDDIYIGQEQTYFVVQINEIEKDNLNETEDFIHYEWVNIDHIIENIVHYKKRTIEKAWKLVSSFV